MQDVAHQNHVGLGQRLLEKAPGDKAQPAGHAVLLDILFKYGSDLGQVKADPRQVGIGQCDLHRQIALRRAGVGESLVAGPWKFRGNGHVCAVADARHRCQERFQPRRIGIKSLKQRHPAAAGFVLRQAGPKSFGEVTPVAIEALVRHFEHAADVGRLVFVEERIGGRSVGIFAARAQQKSQRDQGVQKIARGTRMQAEPPLDALERLRAPWPNR